jgi:hypothetical protein
MVKTCPLDPLMPSSGSIVNKSVAKCKWYEWEKLGGGINARAKEVNPEVVRY